MRLLLDTHVFLWWLAGHPRLSTPAADAIRDAANERFLSSITAVEIAVKSSIGKLSLGRPIDVFVAEGMRRSLIAEIPLLNRHAYRMATLPLHHRDPFERLLVATALEEGLVPVTDDAEIGKYPVPILW